MSICLMFNVQQLAERRVGGQVIVALSHTISSAMRIVVAYWNVGDEALLELASSS